METASDAAENPGPGKAPGRSRDSAVVDVNGAISPQAKASALWRNIAPKSVRETAASDRSVWTKYLAGRRSVPSLARLCGGDATPLLWGLDNNALSAACRSLVAIADKHARPSRATAKVGQKANKALAQWVEASAPAATTVDDSVAVLAAAHLLVDAAHVVDADLWWQVADALYQFVQEADRWLLDPHCAPGEALAQQLLSAELPLTLAYLFPEIKPLYALKASARMRLSEAFEELLNGEGLLHGRLTGAMRPLLACWTRCGVIGERMKKAPWPKDAQRQYGWLVRQSLRWTRGDGRALLGDSRHAPWTADFLATALRLGGDPSDVAAAQALLGKMAPGKPSVRSEYDEPEASDHCEWAGTAILRTSFAREAAVLAVDYTASEMRIEFVVGRQSLLEGTWQSTSSIDGQVLNFAGEWEETCWFSDDDVDYLELGIDLENDARLERQIVLARNDKFLLLSDYLKAGRTAELHHRWGVTLAEGCKFRGEKETREGDLGREKTSARALPLALPEWRADPRVGELGEADGALILDQHVQGRAMAAPLFLDFAAGRRAKPCTWRRLTVAQALEIEPVDVAVGYRVQSAKKQWLIYRSLAAAANRTLLGQNTSAETLIGRFVPPDGELDQLVEVEA